MGSGLVAGQHRSAGTHAPRCTTPGCLLALLDRALVRAGVTTATVILVSDGAPRNAMDATAAADALKNAGYTLVTVAIATSPDSVEFLSSIASRPELAFSVDNFDAAANLLESSVAAVIGAHRALQPALTCALRVCCVRRCFLLPHCCVQPAPPLTASLAPHAQAHELPASSLCSRSLHTCHQCIAFADSDGDGTPDCQDGCPVDVAKTAPGVCGCGVPETDSCNGEEVIPDMEGPEEEEPEVVEDLEEPREVPVDTPVGPETPGAYGESA